MSAVLPEQVRRTISVLHIFKIYYPDVFGGILTVIRSICAGLQGRFRFGALVCSQSRGERRLVVESLNVERVKSFGDLLSLPVAPSYPFRLWQRMAEHDLCVLHAPFPLADLILGFGFGRRQPFIVHWHADIVTRAAFRPLVEPFMRRTLKRAQVIIVSDAALIQNTSLLREFAGKCHVVPFGIDIKTYDLTPAETEEVRALKEEHPDVVFACGRLVPYKGFDVLIRAIASTDATLLIVGEGRERDALEQLCREFGVCDRVRLLGAVSERQLVKLLHIAEAFVLPSVTAAETFGLAQLEAMAAGCPVINTALDTAVPVVARDGQEAITVPPGDSLSLASAITTLLRDKPLRERLGAAGRERAAKLYSADLFKSRIEALYLAACDAGASQARIASTRALSPALQNIRIAAALAWSDIRHRYVRSLLGPFWLSLQMAVTVAVLGAVVGHMSQTEAATILPMLAASMTVWTFFNGFTLDAMSALPNAAGLIKDRALPPAIFILQSFFRHLLFALHNAIVPLALWAMFGRLDLARAAAALPGLVLFAAFTLATGFALGALATRFRDVRPIVESSLMLTFFASPIAWTREMIDGRANILWLNPMTHLFALWREPLLTGGVSLDHVLIALGAAACAGLCGLFALGRLRKAAFWI